MSVILNDYTQIKRLVAAGNNVVYYEDVDVAAGSMVEVTGLTVDTTDQLVLFEAYQKAFVVNGTILKVVDFVNTELTHTALTDAHARGDILAQDQGGGDIAYMLVDHTNSTKTKTRGYAYYAGSATAFNITDAVTGSGSGTGFTPTAVSSSSPIYYDWTVYPGGTFGSMPETAYIGCRYRGRVVLSGNPREPHQWYMSRQNNPWDWLYVPGDPQSPLNGTNSDFGQVGDIVKALIPYKDDYLVFGCASTMWVLAGDPAAGGELRELDLTTGIFGTFAYCWDNKNNLYFMGNNGLYRTQIPNVPVCISQVNVPKLVQNAGATPTTHRVSMGYDRDRHGILVSITEVATGNNLNYWYDLTATDDAGTGGLFPEVYPSQDGVYSMLYYDSNTPAHRGLVTGSKDGYIRTFDDTAKSDDIGATDEAINSYVLIGPFAMSSRPGYAGLIQGLEATLSGSGASGDTDDSDDVTAKLYASRTAAGVIKHATDGDAPRSAGIFKGPGNVMGAINRSSVRDLYGGVLLQNNTADESWAFERLLVTITDSGRAR